LSRIIYHGLQEKYDICRVIEEPAVNPLKIVKGRLKRLNWLTVAGQVLLKLFLEPYLWRKAQKRIEEIKSSEGLCEEDYPAEKLWRVESVNSPGVKEELSKITPDLVIVNGTQIIKPEIFNATEAPFVNMHCGITPRYRGVHGGYWALAEGDQENFGVTVHLIDEGIDTGPILYQETVQPAEEDNFCSYPYLQVTAALPLLQQAVEDMISGKLSPQKRAEMESKCWSHPTLWGYLYRRFRRGVK